MHHSRHFLDISQEAVPLQLVELYSKTTNNNNSSKVFLNQQLQQHQTVNNNNRLVVLVVVSHSLPFLDQLLQQVATRLKID